MCHKFNKLIIVTFQVQWLIPW